MGFPVSSTRKKSAAMQETLVRFLDREDPLEKGMAPHSSILAWRIPRTEEPGRLQSMGCKESDMTEVTEHAGNPSLTVLKALTTVPSSASDVLFIPGSSL